jgi:protein-glutamine gamma-glutamyltransferase
VPAARLDKPLRVLTFAMVLIGVVSVLLTGSLPPPQPVILLGVLALGFFFFWESKLHTRVYLAVWHVLTVVFLVWLFMDLTAKRFSEEDIISRIPVAAMQLSMFLLMFKVYNAKRDRDYVHMFLLSFFLFVSCAGVSVEFSLFLLLVGYLVVTLGAMMVFHFRRQLRSEEAAVLAAPIALSGRVRSGKLLTAGFFTGTLVTAMGVVLIAALIFLFFPRTASSDNPLSLDSFFGSFARRYTTGASGSVDLNIAGVISQDPTPVMRVRLIGRDTPPRNILWRRGAYHQYDGRRQRWLPSFGRHSSRPGGSAGRYKSVVNVMVDKSPGLFVAASDEGRYSSLEELRRDPQLVEQRYALLFGLAETPIYSAYSSPVAVAANASDIECDVNEKFSARLRPRGDSGYTVFSRIPSRQNNGNASEGAAPRDPAVYEAIRRYFTQLPLEIHPRFASLARQIARHAESDYEKAVAVRNYLGVRCRYSLDLTQTPGRNGPLYDFLFEEKPGHCEYFATAAVILMRELGIPSRLAYGYSSGRWNPQEKVFEVRRLDAHAWAEAFIVGKGWLPFDATPAIPDYEEPETLFAVVLRPFSSFLKSCEPAGGDTAGRRPRGRHGLSPGQSNLIKPPQGGDRLIPRLGRAWSLRRAGGRLGRRIHAGIREGTYETVY